MRLIDADELRWTSLQDGFGRINTCIVFESDINAMPTIDAIPVEWIEDYMERLDSVGFLLNNWRHENESNTGD